MEITVRYLMLTGTATMANILSLDLFIQSGHDEFDLLSAGT